MARIEALLNTGCQIGVLLTPLWLAYKFVIFAIS